MILRILASAILLISVLFMPFWLSSILGIAGMIYFRYYLEATFMFLLSDLLFGAHEAKFYHMVFVSFLASMICLITVEYIKTRTRFNNS